MRYLSEEDILVIHAHVLEASGGSDGVRDAHLLGSLVERPKVALFGAESFPTVFEKAAVYLESIARYHVFLDGNKRTAMSASARFLFINGYELEITRKQFVVCAIEVAVGKKSLQDIALWLKKYSKEK